MTFLRNFWTSTELRFCRNEIESLMRSFVRQDDKFVGKVCGKFEKWSCSGSQLKMLSAIYLQPKLSPKMTHPAELRRKPKNSPTKNAICDKPSTEAVVKKLRI